MKKRTMATIVAVAVLGYITKSLYKKFVSPIYTAAKYWDDKHDLVSTIKANDCIVVSTIRNHYMKSPDPAWMTESASGIFLDSDNPTNLSTEALFTAKFAVVEHKLSSKEKREIKALGIALFDRPITLTYEQANLVKEKMISILNNASKKSK